MNDTPVLLSIVVGTYNRLDQIKRCVETIQAQTTVSYMLYITDAGSTDGTVEYLRSIESPRIRISLVGKKLGQARAYNDVFDAVTTPYVCWLSDDNEVVDHGLDVGVAILQSDSRIGMVGLKTQDQQGPFVGTPYIGGISEIGILNVNQGMLRTDVLKQVGGFSEAFRDYGIDPDLTAKVLFSGYDVVYTKSVAIHHYRNWGESKASPEYQAIKERTQRAKKLYARKYAPFVMPSRLWKCKHLALNALKRYIIQSPKNSAKTNGSACLRDLTNILGGRYISLRDPLLSAGKKYHLRQHCPASQLPQALPDDAMLREVA